MSFDIYIGCDPGNTGGITILEDKIPIVYKIPTYKVKKGKRNKTEYDCQEIYSILKQYQNKKVLFTLEQVSSRSGEGVTSSFSFGKGFGILQGIAIGLGFTVELVSPLTWKPKYTQLKTKEFIEFKEQAKEIKGQNKEFNSQIKEIKDSLSEIKDKATKKEKQNIIKSIKNEVKLNYKEIEKLNRKAQSEAKKAARALASDMYPDLKDEFKKVADDGKAESLLIALYGKEYVLV